MIVLLFCFSHRDLEMLRIEKTLGLFFIIMLSGVNANEAIITPRIFGGQDTTPEDYPSFVTVLNGNAFCGGTLIGKEWVLTAGHCVATDNKVAEVSQVSIGLSPKYFSLSIDFLNGNKERSTIRAEKWVDAKRVILHPDYSFPNNDIALVQLAAPVDDLPSIVLNDTSAGLVGQNGVVVGLGEHRDLIVRGVPFSRDLQKATLPIKSWKFCDDAFRGDIPNKIICAGFRGSFSFDRATGICRGDSGGPLYIEKSGIRVQAGITSFGAVSQCGSALPSGYTDISQYKDFLNQHSSPRFFTPPVIFTDSFEAQSTP